MNISLSNVKNSFFIFFEGIGEHGRKTFTLVICLLAKVIDQTSLNVIIFFSRLYFEDLLGKQVDISHLSVRLSLFL